MSCRKWILFVQENSQLVALASLLTNPEPTFLTETWSKAGGNPSSESGREAIVIGQIRLQNQRPILQVSDIIADQEAIRQFLRPFEKQPRPGDYLGHDAKLSSHLAE
jgi:hypothetical protein